MAKSGYGKSRRPATRGDPFIAPLQRPEPVVLEEFDLSQGIHLEGSPREIPLGATPNADGIRFEGRGVRKDFGYRRLGAASIGRALGLIEHKYIDNERLYSLLVRVYRTPGGKITFDVWDGSGTWKSGADSVSNLQDQFLSMASMLGVLFLADGAAVYQWDETPADPNFQDDFPSGNSLSSSGSFTDVVASGAEAANDQYTVHFSASYQDDGTGMGIQGPFRGFNVVVEDSNGNEMGRKDFPALGSGTWNFTHETITFRRKIDPTDFFRLKVVAYPAGLPNVAVNVHGFNLGDGDPAGGLTYRQIAVPANAFAPVSNAPGASWIVPFRDRLIALGDTDTPESLAWTVDGDPTDWTGEGSGQVFVLDSRGDPISELMAAAAVASNVLAVFTRRSILQVQETGNVALAISWDHWIEGLGTDARHSVQAVKDGVMFLGHDLMVYYFSGAVAPQPVGIPIHQALIEGVGDRQDEIDADYDPIFGEYYLKAAGRLWIFSLSDFLEEQKLRWRSRTVSVDRLAVTSRT